VKELSTPSAPPPSGAYSQGIQAGPLIFTAGMGPFDPVTGAVVDGAIEEQTARTLLNLRAVLEEGGSSLKEVVKVTVHLQDVNRDFAGFDGVYRSYFEAPYPVRTTVGSALVGILIEMDVVAVQSSVPA